MHAIPRRVPGALVVVLMLAAGPGVVGAQASPSATTAGAREGWAVADDGVRLHYRVHGVAGHTLIYVHGGRGGNAGRQMPNLLPLAERHVVVAYDQRAGNGRSEVGDTLALGPARHVADLKAVRLAVGADRVALACCALTPEFSCVAAARRSDGGRFAGCGQRVQTNVASRATSAATIRQAPAALGLGLPLATSAAGTRGPRRRSARAGRA